MGSMRLYTCSRSMATSQGFCRVPQLEIGQRLQGSKHAPQFVFAGKFRFGREFLFRNSSSQPVLGEEFGSGRNLALGGSLASAGLSLQFAFGWEFVFGDSSSQLAAAGGLVLFRTPTDEFRRHSSNALRNKEELQSRVAEDELPPGAKIHPEDMSRNPAKLRNSR